MDNPPRVILDTLATTPLAAVHGWRNHVYHGMIRKSGIRFSEQIMPVMTSGGAP
jgi:hypothetical protein